MKPVSSLARVFADVGREISARIKVVKQAENDRHGEDRMPEEAGHDTRRILPSREPIGQLHALKISGAIQGSAVRN
jgi:hypothetical protein